MPHHTHTSHLIQDKRIPCQGEGECDFNDGVGNRSRNTPTNNIFSVTNLKEFRARLKYMIWDSLLTLRNGNVEMHENDEGGLDIRTKWNSMLS